MHYSLWGLLPRLFAAVLLSSVLLAQDAIDLKPTNMKRVVGLALGTVTIDGQDIQVFAQGGNQKNVVYASPFALKLNDQGEVDIQEFRQDFLKENKWRVLLTLRRNPIGTGSKIAEQLREMGIKPDITAVNVNPADVASIEVEDVTPETPDELRFKTFKASNYDGQEIYLETFVSEGDRDKLKAYIEKGAVRFKVTQRLVAEVVEAHSSVSATIQTLQNIGVLREVLSPVNLGNIKFGEAPLVTRTQRLDIIDLLSNYMRVQFTLQEGAPDMAQLEGWIAGMKESWFREVVLKFSAGENWERFSELNLATYGLKDGDKDAVIKAGNQLKEHFEKGSSFSQESVNPYWRPIFGRPPFTKTNTSNSWKESRDSNLKWEGNIPIGLQLFEFDTAVFQRTQAQDVSAARTTQGVIISVRELRTQTPGTWKVSQVRIDVYKKDDIPKLIAAFEYNKRKHDPLPAAKGDAPPANQAVTSPPAPPNRIGKEKASPQEALRRHQVLRLLTLPSISTGDENAGAQIDREGGYLVSVFLNTPAGDIVHRQFMFVGAMSGKVGRLGPVEFHLIGDDLYATLRGPQDL